MSRKKKILEESNSLALKLKDLEEELIEIEAKRVSDTEKTNEFLNDEFNNEYFCGVILTLDDVLAILKLLQGKDNVKIPFNLYINEA